MSAKLKKYSTPSSSGYLKHYGMPRRSGRYKYGSGKEGYQSSDFRRKYNEYKSKGMGEDEIKEKLGLNSTQLRSNITWMNNEIRQERRRDIQKLLSEGRNNSEIAKALNISEGTVRNELKEGSDHKTVQFESVKNTLKEAVDRDKYIDVGLGVEHQIGVPRTRFDAVIDKMVYEEDYHVHNIYVPRLADPEKKTTMIVLTKEPDYKVVSDNRDQIKHLGMMSEDGGETIRRFDAPKPIEPSKVSIKYKEDGGDLRDGLIELNPKNPDLDLEGRHYAQVRILVGPDRYLKGMAVYGDPKDFKTGQDIIFHTVKSKKTDLSDDENKRAVLKETVPDVDDVEVFGSMLMRQNKSRTLNIVNEEGTWDTWSTKLSSQFLSKQPVKLIKDRLMATKKSLDNELEEIDSIINPVVKQHLMEKFSDGLDKKASFLNAKGLPGTKNHVILPFPELNPGEVYAPNYKNGDRVVLVRYPHGGLFELPEVTVNNTNAKAKRVLGTAPDAIGIHPSVAEKLSGADFDGDTVWVIPNNNKQIKTKDSLPELQGFDPKDYKVDYVTVKSKRYGSNLMGDVSNLITDMTIKDAKDSEIARAVKHSMVVIDARKHKLDYKRSYEENDIKSLKEKYQRHINPDTDKPSLAASTLISRSKRKINLGEPNFEPGKYSSGTQVENVYVDYLSELKSLKNTSEKKIASIKTPKYDKEASKTYKVEVNSINEKIIKAKLNSPKERQAQIISNKLYWSNVNESMEDDAKKKLKSTSLARARDIAGAKGGESRIDLTRKEWEAIEHNALSVNKVKEVLNYGDLDQIRKFATPRAPKLSSAKLQQAQAWIDSGKYTYAEVSERLGTTITKASLERGLNPDEGDD